MIALFHSGRDNYQSNLKQDHSSQTWSKTANGPGVPASPCIGPLPWLRTMEYPCSHGNASLDEGKFQGSFLLLSQTFCYGKLVLLVSWGVCLSNYECHQMLRLGDNGCQLLTGNRVLASTLGTNNFQSHLILTYDLLISGSKRSFRSHFQHVPPICCMPCINTEPTQSKRCTSLCMKLLSIRFLRIKGY